MFFIIYVLIGVLVVYPATMWYITRVEKDDVKLKEGIVYLLVSLFLWPVFVIFMISLAVDLKGEIIIFKKKDD